WCLAARRARARSRAQPTTSQVQQPQHAHQHEALDCPPDRLEEGSAVEVRPVRNPVAARPASGGERVGSHTASLLGRGGTEIEGGTPPKSGSWSGPVKIRVGPLRAANITISSITPTAST